jgi:phosphopantothenate---cysteine ligase (CTP)
MRCVVTAGPTYEPLDNVRRLTNFSTGRLGTELARFLEVRGHEVTLLLGEQATFGDGGKAESFTTTRDLAERLRRLANEEINAVFHAAAVSDFGFGKVWTRTAEGELKEVKSGKFSTREGTLLAELLPTPKLISELRKWYPTARLIGWKYEVDGTPEEVIREAQKQLASCLTDACVANGPAYGEGFGLVRSGWEVKHLRDKAALFEELEKLIKD